MSGPRIAAAAVLGLRIAYGAALLVAPGSVTKRWLGPAGQQPAAQVGLRGLGAREIVIHTGGLIAAVGGGPVRPWLAASIAGDLSDIAATTAARKGVPDDAPLLTALVAGGSAALSAAVGAAVDA